MGKQNDKLITNLNRLNEEEKTKQQKSKVYGQKPVKGGQGNKKIRVYNS